jgi:hypothetical protein
MARDNEPGMTPKRKGTSGSGKWTKYKARENSGDADWSKVDEALLLAALVTVTKEGAALLFSRTKDGGALCLTLCDGDDRMKLYGRTREEMNDHLRALADTE